MYKNKKNVSNGFFRVFCFDYVMACAQKSARLRIKTNSCFDRETFSANFLPHFYLQMKWNHFLIVPFFFAALNKKECLRRRAKKSSRSELPASLAHHGGMVSSSKSSVGISMPTKLTQLRYSGYSAEFLDRVEPNGNIPGKNGTSIAGNLRHLPRKDLITVKVPVPPFYSTKYIVRKHRCHSIFLLR